MGEHQMLARASYLSPSFDSYVYLYGPPREANALAIGPTKGE
jgi:hypothetical protein